MKKPQTEPTLAALVATAKTSTDHERVKLKLTHMIAATMADLDALKAERAQAAIEERVPALVQRMTDARETIESLHLAIADAEDRRDKAETEEIKQAMEDGAAAAKAKVPEAIALWQEWYEFCLKAPGIAARLNAKLTEIDDDQAQAIRANRRDLIIHRAQIRGLAAEGLQKPPIHEFSTDVMFDADAIEIAAQQAIEVLLAYGVHRDQFDAKRRFALVNVKGTHADGSLNVEPARSIVPGPGDAGLTIGEPRAEFPHVESNNPSTGEPAAESDGDVPLSSGEDEESFAGDDWRAARKTGTR